MGPLIARIDADGGIFGGFRLGMLWMVGKLFKCGIIYMYLACEVALQLYSYDTPIAF